MDKNIVSPFFDSRCTYKNMQTQSNHKQSQQNTSATHMEQFQCF